MAETDKINLQQKINWLDSLHIFTKKQRKLAIMNRYNKELVKKKAKKSRKKYMKRQMG